MPRSAASDLGLHCLPMSQKWNARLIWVNDNKKNNFLQFSIKNMLLVYIRILTKAILMGIGNPQHMLLWRNCYQIPTLSVSLPIISIKLQRMMLISMKSQKTVRLTCVEQKPAYEYRAKSLWYFSGLTVMIRCI